MGFIFDSTKFDYSGVTRMIIPKALWAGTLLPTGSTHQPRLFTRVSQQITASWGLRRFWLCLS